MKKILFFAVAFIILSIIVTTSPASAQRNTLMPLREGSQAAKRPDRLPSGVGTNLESLKQRADKELTRRIESLQKLLTRITEMKKISVAQKSSLTSQVQAEITKLTTLKAKIAATTDEATLKADVATITSSYRTYALFIPKIQIIGAADRILTTSEVMSSQAARLEEKIKAIPSGEVVIPQTGVAVTQTPEAKNNVSIIELQNLVTDMKVKIADAKQQAQSAIDLVMPLTPEGYPANKTQLQNARQMVVTSLQSLNTARQDAKQIIVGLQKLGLAKENRSNASGSPRLTCIPRPRCLDMNPACDIAEPPNGTWCPKQGQMCAQVLTPARNSTTKECKTFPTACLDAGWVRDTSCSTTDTTQ